MLSGIVKNKASLAVVGTVAFGLVFLPDRPLASGTTMTAGVVMEKMPERERFSYVAGVVEGLAYARFANDDKRTEGMRCIYQWFYQKQGRINDVYQAFDRFKEHLPGAVVAAMVARECGK